jgi:hypothetical protein
MEAGSILLIFCTLIYFYINLGILFVEQQIPFRPDLRALGILN